MECTKGCYPIYTQCTTKSVLLNRTKCINLTLLLCLLLFTHRFVSILARIRDAICMCRAQVELQRRSLFIHIIYLFLFWGGWWWWKVVGGAGWVVGGGGWWGMVGGIIYLRARRGSDPTQIHLILLMTELMRSLIPTLQIIAHICLRQYRLRVKMNIFPDVLIIRAAFTVLEISFQLCWICGPQAYK